MGKLGVLLPVQPTEGLGNGVPVGYFGFDDAFFAALFCSTPVAIALVSFGGPASVGVIHGEVAVVVWVDGTTPYFKIPLPEAFDFCELSKVAVAEGLLFAITAGLDETNSDEIFCVIVPAQPELSFLVFPNLSIEC